MSALRALPSLQILRHPQYSILFFSRAVLEVCFSDAQRTVHMLYRKTAAAFGTLYIYYAAALRLAPEQKLSAYRTGDKILPF